MAEIARALLVPEAAMAKRSSRAKQQLRSAGVRFDLPPAAGWAGRLQVVLHVLGLVFSQGYNSTSGPDLQRADLTTEAIPLARLLRQLVPADGEVAGLLALLLPTDARHAARTTADRSLVPAGRAAARPVGHHPDRGGRGAAHPHPWHRPGRPRPAPGGQRCRA
jgi:predicted RNA polymerase sigma factor